MQDKNESHNRVQGIFCHDLPIMKSVQGRYYSSTLTDELFSRYLDVVDELLVATRVCSVGEGELEGQNEITLSRVRFVDLPNVNAVSAPFREIPQAKKRLQEAMRGVDLVFIRGGMVARLGVDEAKRQKKPYLLESSGCAWDIYWNHSLLGKMIAPYMEYREKKDIRDASYVLYVTSNWLQEKYPTKGEVESVSDVLISGQQDETLLRRLNRIAAMGQRRSIVLGTLANVDVKYKGHAFVIRAIKQLEDRYDIKYEMVGGGKGDNLRRIANSIGLHNGVLCFKGEMSHEQVMNWLDGIDVYIQPSLAEGLPRSVVEAMSRACPVIGSDIAGIPELLESHELFRPGSSAGLAQVLEEQLKSDLTLPACRNYSKAALFDESLLNERRSSFFWKYRNFVLGDS